MSACANTYFLLNNGESTMLIEFYTDGACKGNPGNGGWASVMVLNNECNMVTTGKKRDTTNNAMELTAIVKSVAIGLRYIYEWRMKNAVIVINSDSAYCVNAINNKWVYNWMENGWETKAGEEVKNRELWERFVNYMAQKGDTKVFFNKVKGHSGNKYNEVADKKASEAAASLGKTT
nr:MAG TPA: ribonuclease HI [Caudoviricetes sp.]